MKLNEFTRTKIGQTFYFNGIKLKVVETVVNEATEHPNVCVSCIFKKLSDKCPSGEKAKQKACFKDENINKTSIKYVRA